MDFLLTVWGLFFVAIVSYIVVKNKKRVGHGSEKEIETSFNDFEHKDETSRVTDPKFMHSAFNIYN